MSGMNILDMIMAAQGGKAAGNMGKQFGLNTKQSKGAIAALLPAVSSALKQNTASPQGLQSLLGALQGGGHEQFLDNAEVYAEPETSTQGNAILGHLFGTKDVSRTVAGQASIQSGIDKGVLQKMLPMVATMAMGSLSKQTQEPSMASQLAGLALGGGSNRPQAGGLGGLLGALTGSNKRQAKAQVQRQQAHTQGMGILGNLLDADGDGNTMDDIIGMAMKNMMK